QAGCAGRGVGGGRRQAGYAGPIPEAQEGSTGPARRDGCPAWDLSGRWMAGDGTATLWLLQDGDGVAGWYAPPGLEGGRPPSGSDLPGAAGNGAAGVADAGAPPGASWTVDGTLSGGVLRLTLYAGDSVTLSRTLVLDPVAGTLSGPWPLAF